ncbi:MAG: hypothetical protein J1E29_01330 [Duncaniella sp.]|nr:hypothetical protein [Duncaniella sp.]
MTDHSSDIVTSVFKTTSGEYLYTLLSIWIPRHGWPLALTPIAFVVLAATSHDWRFALVALMTIFIIMPMVLSWIYIYYLLTPEARRALLPKRVQITPGESLLLVYEPATADNGTTTFFPPEKIEAQDIKRVMFAKTGVVYLLRAPMIQFIIVPYSVLPAGVTRRELSF